jgi:hypothetical protein
MDRVNDERGGRASPVMEFDEAQREAGALAAEDDLAKTLAAMLQLSETGLFGQAYASPLDSDDVMLPPGLRAAQASPTSSGEATLAAQRSKQIAALIATVETELADVGGGEPIPQVLDATGLPESVRRKDGETFDVAAAVEAAAEAARNGTAPSAGDGEESARGGSSAAAASASHGAAKAAPSDQDDNGGGDGDHDGELNDDSVLTQEEQRRLLLALQRQLQDARTGNSEAFERLQAELAASTATKAPAAVPPPGSSAAEGGGAETAVPPQQEGPAAAVSGGGDGGVGQKRGRG